jgi:DNA-binding transcriptional ArsR family regulator
VSIELVAAALWLPLEASRKLVLIALCERADFRTGLCWPSREEIAIRSSLSPRRVTPHIQALEDAGYLRSIRGISRKGETTKRYLAVDLILAMAQIEIDLYRSRWRMATANINDPDPFQLAFDAIDDPDDGAGQGAETLGDVSSPKTD